MSTFNDAGQRAGTVTPAPNGQGLEAVGSVRPLTLCAGARSTLRPGAPHVLCRDCARFTRTEKAGMKQALQLVDGSAACANKAPE